MLLLVIVWGASAASGAVYYLAYEFARDLPEDLTTAIDYQPHRATRVYASDGELIGEFFLTRRIVVASDRIPDHVKNAFISAEDRRFWQHPGFDLIGIARAAYTNYKSGRTRQGASTITQQVTRMLMLSDERSYERKIKELILSIRVESELSKADILHIYANHVYLGRGAYGVQAGAEVYFGKTVEHLTIAEAAMLAGLVQAPTRYAPPRNIDAARARQVYVLDRMLEDAHITAEQHAAAIVEPLAFVRGRLPLNHVAAPYFVEHIRRWATRRLGYRSVFYGGLQIFTTLDSRMQRRAETAVRDGLVALDRRIGFRGPLGHVDGDALTELTDGPPRPYVEGLDELARSGGSQILPSVAYVGAVVDVSRGGVKVDLGPETLAVIKRDAQVLRRWRGDKRTRLRVGDLVPVRLARAPNSRARQVELAQAPDVQGALVAMEPATGRITAMVGGLDYAHSQYNRATQAQRQIGSAIKPFIYAAAMDRGMTHVDIVTDAPVSVRTAGGWWSPANYDNKYRGRMTLRRALAKSLNTVSVRLVLKLGVTRVIALMRAMGVRSELPRHVSIALGTADMTLIEVTAGYAAFANGGLRTEPRLVDYVTDATGRVIEDYRDRKPTERAISPELAYLTTSLMENVITGGTGRRAQALGRPVAGKTGTSTEYRDAWFVGFTPDLLCGVWVGRDDSRPIGIDATGGDTALPIWLAFMQAAHPDTPVRPFPPPGDIIFARADAWTGKPQYAGSPYAIWVPFARGTLPEMFAPRIRKIRFDDAPEFPHAPRNRN